MKRIDSDILTQFAENLKVIRKNRNLSQEDLADLAGVHRTYIGMIERREKNITLISLEKISKALQINIEDLIKNNHDANK